jgi:membrane-associated phospholipid phosphatase
VGLAEVRAYLRKRFSKEETVGLYLAVGFLVCLALAVSLGLLAREIAAVTTRPEPFDRAVGGFLARLRSPELTRLMRAVSVLGDHRFLLLATPLVSAGLLLGGHRVSALLFSGSVVGGFGLNSALKIALARARPDFWPALVEEKTYSFPSGHSAMSTVFFGGLVAVVFRLRRRRSDRIAALVVGIVCVAGVSASRIYLGAHWATDTVAGVLLGLFWVTVYATGTEYFSRRATRPRKSARPR